MLIWQSLVLCTLAVPPPSVPVLLCQYFFNHSIDQEVQVLLAQQLIRLSPFHNYNPGQIRIHLQLCRSLPNPHILQRDLTRTQNTRILQTRDAMLVIDLLVILTR